MASDNNFLENLLSIPAESQAVEFKRLTGSRVVEKTIETIVAMANAEGGTIILGVEDPEKARLKGKERIFGVDEDLENYDALGREIRKIMPPICNVWPPKEIAVDKSGKRIALIFIEKAADNFHYINNHVYLRQEKSNKLLSPREIISFAYAKGFQKADRELADIDFDLLNTEYFKEWKEARNIKGASAAKVLEKTGLARKNEGGKLLPTRAAVLLFAEYPSDLMETKCAVRIFQYSGTVETIKDVPNLIGTPKTLQGPVIKLIKDSHDYILTLLRSGIRIPSGFVTEYQIPERAVKEAVTNAIIHRDYYKKRDIEVKIFEDRVEIENPGLFPYNITTTNIGHVRADGYRNDLLVKHLREFPSPPNLDQNEGVKAMRSEMRENNLYPPVFWTYPNLENSIRVILLNEKIASEWEKVSFYLFKNKYITNEEARKVTGIVQRDKMSRTLKNWMKSGLLMRINPSSKFMKGVKYKLPEVKELEK